MTTKNAILKQIRLLPHEQKSEIVEALITELSVDDIPPLTEAWMMELDRREEASDADPSRLLTREQYKAELDKLVKYKAKKRV